LEQGGQNPRRLGHQRHRIDSGVGNAARKDRHETGRVGHEIMGHALDLIESQQGGNVYLHTGSRQAANQGTAVFLARVGDGDLHVYVRAQEAISRAWRSISSKSSTPGTVERVHRLNHSRQEFEFIQSGGRIRPALAQYDTIDHAIAVQKDRTPSQGSAMLAGSYHRNAFHATFGFAVRFSHLFSRNITWG
jgi:hypothetical protein